MKLLLFPGDVFLRLLCAVFDEVVEIVLAVLILRLDVAEDDFIESCPELVVCDVCADSLQVLLRKVLNLFRKVQGDLRIEQIPVRLASIPVQRSLKVLRTSAL